MPTTRRPPDLPDPDLADRAEPGQATAAPVRRRRALLAGASALAGVVATGRAAEPAAASDAAWKPTDPAIVAGSALNPLVLPKTEFVYEAAFDLLPMMPLGQSPYGERRIIPITGGRFQGPRMAGKILPGADRQLVRSDGSRILDATYELQTDDGAVISVRNRVLSRPARGNVDKYVYSTLEITAPDGPYGWLNDYVYVGTLNSMQPARAGVLIRVYRVV